MAPTPNNNKDVIHAADPPAGPPPPHETMTTDEVSSEDEQLSDGSESEYASFSDSDSESSDEELTEEQRRAEREAREVERQRVLEAAGLVVKAESKPPPRPPRSKSSRSTRRRPPPAVPDRNSIVSNLSDKDLPPVPSADEDADADAQSVHLDDAYERYEAFKKSSNGHMNRLSVSSFDTAPPSPRSPSSLSASLSRATSRESESGRSHSHFLHFLGRKTPANDGEKRTLPVISGPILDRPATPIERENSPAFGTSWSSLVDKNALFDMPTHERRRQEATFELITTEAAYVRDLQLIVGVFYSHMLPLLDEKAMTVIFANVEDILLTNTGFLSSLEEKQKECRLYIDKIGDLLAPNMGKMDIYMDYCVNQGTAIKVLQSLRDENPELAALLKHLRDNEPSVRNLDLSSYLLVPMQRITRYPLLIRQILHYTDDSDDKTQIEQALETAENILAHINESIREQEGRQRLREISKELWIGQGRLDLTAPTRYMGSRRLLKEGLLFKAKSGRKLRGFLCSDILVLTDENAKSLYRMPIPLAEARTRDLPGARDDSAFQISLAYPRGGDTINLRATSVRDCQMWMEALEKAGQACKEAESFHRRALDGRP